MTNTVQVLSVLQLSLIASHTIYILIAFCGCSSSIVVDLISSAVMQSGMSAHDSMAFMVMLIYGISVSVSCLCLDIWSGMKICGLGLYSICMPYGWRHNICKKARVCSVMSM